MNYPRLFEPFAQPSGLKLKNRLVMAPMTTTSSNDDSSFSDAEIAYLEKRAQSGIGLIMTPACYCHKSGHSFDHQVGCHDDSMLPRLTLCAEAINRHGAASFLQIHHGGNAAKQTYTGRPPMAPSAVHNRRGTSELPAAMTEDEIWMIVNAFAKAAVRARNAGFSGIEIHGANGYVFQQFFSTFTNKRTDKWGGDCRCDRCELHKEHTELELCHRLTNRARFASEVIKAVRAAVGPDYPISYRITPEEPEPDGYTTYDTIELLRILVPLGIDIVHISTIAYGTGLYSHYPDGTHPDLLIRRALSSRTAVIGVGSVYLPDQAMRVLGDGLDLVAMGRSLLLNADWAQEVRDDQVDSIKTSLKTEEERYLLDIPEPMKEYVRGRLPVSSA
jgi:2,4-dienoyl-CoA reductase-like NADH-dependent reductase (Old Yellow Enzyme family)